MSRKIAQDFNTSFSKINVAEVLRKISSEIFVLENVAEDCAIFQPKFHQSKCNGSFAEDFIRGCPLKNIAEDCARFQLNFH